MAPKRKAAPRGSAKKAPKPKAGAKKPASPRSAKKAKTADSPKQLDFASYADADEGVVTFEGLGRLGDDLGVDAASDTKLLVLCWRLQAERPGSLSEEEWNRLGTSPHLPTCGGPLSVEALKRGWGSLDPNFLENAEFRPFFKFCFEFNREGTKRFLERDTALALLPLCIEDRSPHTELFLEFLATKPEDFKLNRDQWCSFLDFSLAVGPPPEFDKWDADESSWPILLDEYVEYAKDKFGVKPMET